MAGARDDAGEARAGRAGASGIAASTAVPTKARKGRAERRFGALTGNYPAPR
jgi:hypothetical protein